MKRAKWATVYVMDAGDRRKVGHSASWAGHYLDAEQKFREINIGKPDGVRDYVPARTGLE
jgi:hypothetical protein